MKYKHVKTGDIRDFNCTINSDVWRPLEETKEVSKPIKEEIKKPVKKTRITKTK